MTTRFTLFLLIFLPLTSACLFAPRTFDETAWRRTVESQDPALLYAPHEKDGVYFNPWSPEDEGRFGAFLRWRLTRRADYSAAEQTYLPVLQDKLVERIGSLPAEADFIAWIGHGTFLLRLSGEFWLTDPMLSKRALLPARVTPPALRMEELAAIDAPLTVLISHNHYDHLDEKTIAALPAHARIFVPPGLGPFVSARHDGEVIELDWWEAAASGPARVTALPMQHWSRRIGQGRNTTLWSSYMIETPELKVYFGGDSGYFVGYREFGRRFAPIDYALLPITAYHPRWFMHYPHMNIDEALRAFSELGARWFVPTQWGTFRLGDNPPGYPIIDLKRHIEARGLDPTPYLLPDLGEIIELSPAS